MACVANREADAPERTDDGLTLFGSSQLLTMNIAKLSAILTLLVRGVDGTCQCKDVCQEYERHEEKCWSRNSECSSKYRLGKCEDNLFGTCFGRCKAGDLGACISTTTSYNLDHVTYFTWCPGTCACNIFGCNCDACEGCVILFCRLASNKVGSEVWLGRPLDRLGSYNDVVKRFLCV